MKARKILRENDAAFHETARNRAQPRMDDHLSGNQNRKRHQEPRMHFNVVKEGKPAGAASPGTEDSEEQ